MPRFLLKLAFIGGSTPGGVQAEELAPSFECAIQQAERHHPLGMVTHIRCNDDRTTLLLTCPKCHMLDEASANWNNGSCQHTCTGCGRIQVVSRSRTAREGVGLGTRRPGSTAPPVIETPNALVLIPQPEASGDDQARPSHEQAQKSPPREGKGHIRNPSLTDRARATIQNPADIHWSCPECNLHGTTKWQNRFRVQVCKCGFSTFLSADMFEWQSRIMHDRKDRDVANADAVRQRNEVDRERQKSIDAARVQREQQARLAHTNYLYVVIQEHVAAGVVSSVDQFGALSQEDKQLLIQIHALCEEMKSDLLRHIDLDVSMDKSATTVKSMLGGAALGAAISGNWSSIAFGLAAAGVRTVKNESKANASAELRRKWIHRLASLRQPHLDAFAMLFRYKYPLLANILERSSLPS